MATESLKLTVEHLAAGYGAVRALHDVSLEVQSGEIVALLGTNGNGKSTLMKCIMGLVTPVHGSIVLEIDGVRIDLTRKSPQQIVSLGIALVPEGRRLFPRLTVKENLLLGAFRHAARNAVTRNLALCYEVFDTACGQHERRPAADARDCACHHVGAPHAADR
jgi:branched-chain amino acid transport system ATP-binding protein